MRTQTNAQLLSVYVGEEDRYRGGLLYPAIVSRFKELGIAGVTVLQGSEGYGIHGHLHSPRAENFFQGLPVLIEAVVVPDRISIAVAALDSMLVEGLVTVQEVTAIRYIKDPKFGHSGVR